ncbi:hypothetical protein [Streptomyces sp. NBC_01462]|uniref:hypothetical protein n=1 Tax=Streptomyces sp. NBC_01462 TaxID=2903876 RepID=UPI002E34D99D|nr:hypothetical protein [Streptomyces sp. NBC_01462]
METPDLSFQRRLLNEALTVVAAPAQVQTAWLEKHGVVTDEIALDFDHAFRMAEGLVEEGFLSRDALPELRLIDSIFDGMSCDESTDRWTAAALISDVGWIRARVLAQQVLAREGVNASPLPDISVVR